MQLIYHQFLTLVAVFGCTLIGGAHAAAQGVYLEDDGRADGPDIEDLSVLDLRYMDDQRADLQDVAAERCSMPYRPPELFQVNSKCEIDERTDVWVRE